MIKPWLLLPAKWAHDLSPLFLKTFAAFSERTPPTWRTLVWKGLVFQNPLGIAGGVDKNADFIKAWPGLGCGFVEIGTVTPRPQTPNPGRILDRDRASRAMWNRMGFPSAGAEETLANLKAARPFATPIFVNIGKNRETPNENAAEDYLALVHYFRDHADAFVVNISSPNTKGLRDLQGAEPLRKLLSPLVAAAAGYGRPLLVKLSPDLADAELEQSLEVGAECGVDGFILTNTTLSREPDSPFPPEGGVSGQPLKEISKRVLRRAVEILGPRRRNFLLVSVGGIMTADDVFERLDLGADLVEVYSALVFEGPGFFGQVAKKAMSR